MCFLIFERIAFSGWNADLKSPLGDQLIRAGCTLPLARDSEPMAASAAGGSAAPAGEATPVAAAPAGI